MTRILWLIVLGGLFAIGGAVLVSRTSCADTPTKVERRADSALATVPAWQDTVKVRDSVIAVKDKAREREHLARLAERKRADQAEALARSLQSHADTLAIIPEGSASDSVSHLLPALAAQQKATAQFALVVDSLRVHRTADSTRLVTANGTIAQMKSWRTEDLARIDTLTVRLSDLREESKQRGKFLGFFPPWIDEALLVTGGVIVGYAVAQGS